MKLCIDTQRAFAAAILLACTFPAFAAAAKKKIIVAADGSGQFKTVQQAVDSAPDGNVVIRIKPGVYRQVVAIATNGVELRGMGKHPQDVVLIYDNSAGTPAPAGSPGAPTLGTGRSATVTVTGDDFIARNLTIANDFEKHDERSNQGSQAVALRVTGDREIFRHVRLLGYQDTLYADSKSCHTPGDTSACSASRQYFQNCYIEGHVDFIFGDAKAVFDHCELHGMAHQMVTFTAQSRLRPTEDSGYLFLHTTITADPGATDILLGRPWRDYSTVVFVDTDFRAPIDSKGWMEWGGRLKTSYYAEYRSHGQTGDISQRVSPSLQFTPLEAVKFNPREWLAGSDHWDPGRPSIACNSSGYIPGCHSAA